MAAAGGVTPDLPVTSDLVMHFRADLGITKDGSDYVSQWDDQSVNNRHLTEATNKPLWVDGLVNGRPAVRFDGANDQLSEAGGTVAQPVHVFTVANYLTWTNGETSFGYRTVPGAMIQQRTSTPRVYQLIDNISGGYVSPTLGTFFLIHHVISNASSSLALNDGGDVGGATGTRTMNGGFTMGAEFPGAGWCNVEVAEAIVYDAIKSGGDLTSIKNYLNDLYALW